MVTGQVALGAGKCMGIVFSKDGGTTWTPVRINAVTNSQANVAAIAPNDAKVLYAGGQTSSYTGLAYRSADGGVNWTSITGGIQSVPLAIAVDPQDSNIVYIGTFSELWRSANGGTSWTKCVFPTSSWGYRAVAINKNNPNEVFVGHNYGVFYSLNRGLTWTDVSQGLPVPYVSQLYFNPTTRTLYAGTEGGGICKRTF